MDFRILCGGPISEDRDVFVAHIESLLNQGYLMDYKGIDNSPEPLPIPSGFGKVEWRRDESMGEYKQNRIRWSRHRMIKMGIWREEMRRAAIDGKYDYLFMVDSDLILEKNTLQLLLDAGKDFIAGLFWTRFRPWNKWQWPNCWSVDENFNRTDVDEKFRNKLRNGGIHEVGLTGACSLITKKILDKISYAPVPGSMGEDMWLTMSARKAGIPLYVHADVTIEHRRRR